MHRFSTINLILLLVSIFTTLHAQNNYHEIKVKIKDFDQKEMYLAVNYGEKQYLQDTAYINDAGEFIFAGTDTLDPGIYLVVLPPNNNYLQILVNQDGQKFTLTTDTTNLALGATFEGSSDNQLFYDYLKYINQKGIEAGPLKQQMESKAQGDPVYDAAMAKLKAIDEEVTAEQKKIVMENPTTFTAMLVKANMNITVPEFEGTDDEKAEKEWRYRQKHHFDNYDLGDPRLLRTPFLFPRVDFFVNRLHVRHPDSMVIAIDHVLEKMKPASNTYQYYVSHFLNFFASSKYVGMDAGYVHMVDKYYKSGEASWVKEEDLKKIVENSDKLKPLLIGKKAPNIEMQKKDGSKISLYDINTPFTILYFWRYDCGACKKSTPHMKEFYENFKDRGVTLMAVCSKFLEEIDDCWKYIDENEIGDWLHTVDPYNRSKFQTIYDIRSTPQMYILDKDKEIISKRIGAEQLEEVMDQIIKAREKENAGEE